MESKETVNQESCSINDCLREKENEYEDLAGYGDSKNQEITYQLTSEHKLNSTWCFWYASRKIKDHSTPYADRIKKFAEFTTVEDFFKYYVYLKSASEIERNTDISLFKQGYKPLWENCPNSGILFVRYKKNEECYDLDLKWEKLLFALIGEQFEDNSILGCTLSIRGRETIMEVWFTYNKNETLKNLLVLKMTTLVDLDKQTVFFKDNSQSLQDGSTLKNVEPVASGKRKMTLY